MQPVVHRRSQLACACCVCVCVCVRVAGGVCLGGWLTSPATARVSYRFCPSYIYLKNMGLSTLRATLGMPSLAARGCRDSGQNRSRRPRTLGPEGRETGPIR